MFTSPRAAAANAALFFGAVGGWQLGYKGFVLYALSAFVVILRLMGNRKP